jgi:hypothetical protein
VSLPSVELGVSFGTNPGSTPSYTVVPIGDLLELSTERGRNEELGISETGVSTILLSNQKRKFDPSNASGPYYPNVIPVRRARIRATDPQTATVHDVAVGDVEDWPQQYSGRENRTPIRILDGFDALAGASFSASRSQEGTGARIAAVLDAVGWPAADRALDTGLGLVSAEVFTEATALGAIQDAADAESGLFFIDKSGKAVFHSRDRRWKAPYDTPAATFSDNPSGGELPLSGVSLLYRRDRIFNRVALSAPGLALTVREDATSKGKYRVRSFVKSYKVATQPELDSKAEYILGISKDAILRPDALVLEPQLNSGLWAQALGREVGDRIRVKVEPLGTPVQTLTFDVHIEKISHLYVPGRWTTTFRLSPAEVSAFWILGTSTLGTSTRLGY